MGHITWKELTFIGALTKELSKKEATPWNHWKPLGKQRFELGKKRSKSHGFPKPLKTLGKTKVSRHRRGHDGAGSRGAQCPGSLWHNGKPLRKQRFHAQVINAHGIPRWSMATNHTVSKNPWKTYGKSTFRACWQNTNEMKRAWPGQSRAMTLVPSGK